MIAWSGRSWFDDENAVIQAVSDVKFPGPIKTNSMWLVQLQCGSPCPTRTFLGAARYCHYLVLPGQILADDVVVSVRNEDIVMSVDAEVLRFVEECFQSIAVVSSKTFASGSSYSANFALSVHLPQSVAAPFQDIEIAL